MGELRGGYIPGDLPPDEQERAELLLFEHLMDDGEGAAEDATEPVSAPPVTPPPQSALSPPDTSREGLAPAPTSIEDLSMGNRPRKY